MEDQPLIQEFSHGLLWARREDGDPSFRVIRRRMDGAYSISSISRVLAGESFPKWDFTRKFLHACHVSEEEINGTWHARWIAIAAIRSPIPGGGPAAGTTEAPARSGTECAECGALVTNQIRHKAWHQAYAPREQARAATRALRSLPG